jgi:hypothetical protein
MKGSNLEEFHLLRGEHVIVLHSIASTNSSTFSHVIPIITAYQTPLLFRAEGDYLSYSIEQQGRNNIVTFLLPHLKHDEEIKIRIEYCVLVKKLHYDELLMKKNLPLNAEEIPEEAKEWLTSSQSIQANNIFIRMTAALLTGFSRELLPFIRKVMVWNAYHGTLFSFIKRALVVRPLLNKIFLPDQYWIRFEDALSTLFLGGVCAGQTNLGVAILRAREIPARVLITTSNYFGKDVWLDSQHYILEFYYVGYGWVPAFSGQAPLPSSNNIILRIVDTKEENISGSGQSLYGGEAPWFWIENENIILGKPQGYMSYRLPQTKKTGVPAVRGWKDGKIGIPKEHADEIVDLLKETWKLFTDNAGSKPERTNYLALLQGRTTDYLKKGQFTECQNALKEACHLAVNMKN